MGQRLNRGFLLSNEKAQQFITYCYKLGAEYITFIGGEPTLHPDLPNMVDYAVQTGYKQVMIDSNGLNIKNIKKIPPEHLSYVTISLDGASPEVHEKVRGPNTFSKTLASIKELISIGYKVRINCTIFQFNLDEAPLLLGLADELGIKLVNFHVFSEEGNGAKKPCWSLSPDDWIKFCNYIDEIRSNYKTSIWYPPTWSTVEQLPKYVKAGYRGCLGCSLDRLSIFPDGQCYVCSVLFDQAAYFGKITDNGFVLNRNGNEFELFTRSMFQASEPWLTGCPAEAYLAKAQGVPETLVSICRCWKVQA